jgi:hypothetical protein
MFQYCEIQRDTALDRIAIHYLYHAPETYPIPIVAVGVLLYIGIRSAWPGIPDAIIVWKIFIMFNVGSNPKSHTGLIGPGKRGTINNRAVVYSIGGQRHKKTPPVWDITFVAAPSENYSAWVSKSQK